MGGSVRVRISYWYLSFCLIDDFASVGGRRGKRVSTFSESIANNAMVYYSLSCHYIRFLTASGINFLISGKHQKDIC